MHEIKANVDLQKCKATYKILNNYETLAKIFMSHLNSIFAVILISWLSYHSQLL